jgi:hypothetical protein
MEESNRLKELELKKHDLESDIAFVKSAYKYDLQRLEYQLGGIDNKLRGMEQTIRSQHGARMIELTATLTQIGLLTPYATHESFTKANCHVP